MNIVTELKDIAELVKKMGDIDLYRKIVELEGQVIELTRSNRELIESNEALQESLKMKDNLKFKEPFYYAENDMVPYCPKCWEDDNIAIHMVAYNKSYSYRTYVCPKCKTPIGG